MGSRSPYCPFLILTATSSDFSTPGSVHNISELSFSCLHLGGEDTGYLRQPQYQSLSKCTALTGAGCLDAVSLTMSDVLALRFWLEVLNLSWGDFVLFKRRRVRTIERLAKRAGRHEEMAYRCLHRLPGGVFVFLVAVTFNAALWHERLGGSCTEVARLYQVGMFLFFTLYALSFYWFFPLLEWTTLSPLMRQVHQATRYLFKGDVPPYMLYATDGGVKDCTSLLQLFWRRSERILLVLAAADASDDFGVLRAALREAKEQRLASVYDPEDPRNSIDVVLERFKDDKQMPYMHLGVCYPAVKNRHDKTTGHLYVVKNRLPPSFVGQPVQPLLTMEGIVGRDASSCHGMASFPSTMSNVEDDDLTTDQLGSFGCCDCCHSYGMNCGPKFPHGAFTGYMYLTPMWCNSLVRLGFDASEQAVAEVTREGPLAAHWELNLDQ